MTNSCENICYFRVSKTDETEQDLDQQVKAVIERYKLKDPKIFIERGSAYNLDKIENRLEFFNMLNYMFDADKTTITDVFKGNIPKKNINLYVFGYDRIMRNLELNMLFSILTYLSGNDIYSYKEDHIITKRSGSSIERFTNFLLISISAQSSESYSESISLNTKKSFKLIEGATFSVDGNKVGSKFKNVNSDKISISSSKLVKMNHKIIELCNYYEGNNFKGYYNLIINSISSEFGIKLSKGYLSKIKLKNG